MCKSVAKASRFSPSLFFKFLIGDDVVGKIFEKESTELVLDWETRARQLSECSFGFNKRRISTRNRCFNSGIMRGTNKLPFEWIIRIGNDEVTSGINEFTSRYISSKVVIGSSKAHENAPLSTKIR